MEITLLVQKYVELLFLVFVYIYFSNIHKSVLVDLIKKTHPSELVRYKDLTEE